MNSLAVSVFLPINQGGRRAGAEDAIGQRKRTPGLPFDAVVDRPGGKRLEAHNDFLIRSVQDVLLEKKIEVPI